MDGYDLEAIDDNEFVRILRLNRDSNRRALVESRDANRSSIINQAVAAFLKCDDLLAGSARARHPTASMRCSLPYPASSVHLPLLPSDTHVIDFAACCSGSLIVHRSSPRCADHPQASASPHAVQSQNGRRYGFDDLVRQRAIFSGRPIHKFIPSFERECIFRPFRSDQARCSRTYCRSGMETDSALLVDSLHYLRRIDPGHAFHLSRSRCRASRSVAGVLRNVYRTLFVLCCPRSFL